MLVLNVLLNIWSNLLSSGGVDWEWLLCMLLVSVFGAGPKGFGVAVAAAAAGAAKMGAADNAIARARRNESVLKRADGARDAGRQDPNAGLSSGVFFE